MRAERSFKKKKKSAPKPKIKYEKMVRLPPERAYEAHKEAMARGAKCEECPLYGLKVGPVLGDVTSHARLTIIGEAPSDNELDAKRLFVGKSGEILDGCLNRGGVERSDCTITDAILCRPPEEMQAFERRLKILHEQSCERAKKNGRPEPEPPKLPSECCFPRLQNDIKDSEAKVVLAVGGRALRGVAEHWDVPFGNSRKTKADEIKIGSLKKQIGSPLTLPDGTIVVASYHPAFAMRKGSRHYMHVVKKHIQRGAEIAKRGYIDWKEPAYILNPDVETVERVLASMKGKKKTIDIETDKGSRPDGGFDPYSCRIRCIGVGAVVEDEEVVIVVPIRKMNGDEWWTGREGALDFEAKKRVVEALLDALNDDSIDPETNEQACLIGHNLAFDTSVLLRFGLLLDRNQLYEDTMILHHDTPDNDLPHDLGFVAARYFEVPSWKGVADDKYYDSVTDADLHLYNARDVLTTMRLYPVLIDEVYRHGTLSQYQLDQKLAPISRDMGQLGLFVDEKRRGELAIEMNQQAHKKLLRIKEIVGDKSFNPASPKQLRKYLFGTKKLMPVLNSKGKDWEEGEDPSTNTQALMKLLLQQGCDDETKDFINNLFEFRAYAKLSGTYINKLRVTYEDWDKYGLEGIETLPEVQTPALRKFKKTEKKDIAAKLYPEEWADASASIPKGLTKTERKLAMRNRKIMQDRILSRIEDAVFEDHVVITERPSLSRLHTTYKIHIIPSGRMSTAPAVQNWPSRGKANMQEMIIAPPGHVMVGADLDQVELRLYAAIAGDKILLEAFDKGLDPHSYNAASLFASRFSREFGHKVSIMEAYEYIIGLPRMHATEYAGKAHGGPINVADLDALASKMGDEASDDEVLAVTSLPKETVLAFIKGWSKGNKEKKKLRGYAKTFAYLETYGGEADKLFAFMSTARDKATGALMFPNLKEEDVLEWHEEWHKTHPETKQWQEACQRIARLHGFTAAPIGSFRKRFFPGGPNKPGAVFNHVIQSAAAEITNLANIKIAEQIPYQCWSPFTGVCLQVHDYIGVYVPEEYAQLAKKIIEEAMCCVVFGIPITATAKISKRWSEQ